MSSLSLFEDLKLRVEEQGGLLAELAETWHNDYSRTSALEERIQKIAPNVDQQSDTFILNASPICIYA